MESNKYDKKKNRKLLLIFIVFFLGCFFGGMIMGALSVLFGGAWNNINWASIIDMLLRPTVIFFVALVIGCFIFSLCYFNSTSKAIKEAEKLDDDDFEDALEDLERKLNIPLVVEGAVIIIAFFFFGLIIYMGNFLGKEGYPFDWWSFIPTIVFFIVNLFFQMFVSNKVIERIKDLHPEKRGSVIELNFRKKWANSLDEAEALELGKKSYKAYVAGMTTSSVMWLVSVMGLMTLDTGMLPVAICCIIMLVMFLTASIEKKEKKKDKEEE